MRYSTSSPDSAGVIGGLSYDERSSQRFWTSRSAMVEGGRGDMLKPPDPRANTGRACGLEMRSGAVTPAALRIFTRNVRQPCSTNSGRARPATTCTRLSGLMPTSSRQ